MTRSFPAAFLLSLALSGAAAAQPPPAEPPGPYAQPLPTPDFVAAVLQSDGFEQEEGRLAAKRSRSPAVRRFASDIVRDHATSTRRLTAAARRAGLPPPPSPGLALGQQQELQRLEAAGGADFDRLYLDQQVRAHAALLANVTSYVDVGRPGPVRQAALRIRPTIAQHLAALRRLQAGPR